MRAFIALRLEVEEGHERVGICISLGVDHADEYAHPTDGHDRALSRHNRWRGMIVFSRHT